jgi:hypothetical protein
MPEVQINKSFLLLFFKKEALSLGASKWLKSQQL